MGVLQYLLSVLAQITTFGAQRRWGLIYMSAEEENSTVTMLIDIFEKRSVKYNKKAIRTLLG